MCVIGNSFGDHGNYGDGCYNYCFLYFGQNIDFGCCIDFDSGCAPSFADTKGLICSDLAEFFFQFKYTVQKWNQLKTTICVDQNHCFRQIRPN